MGRNLPGSVHTNRHGRALPALGQLPVDQAVRAERLDEFDGDFQRRRLAGNGLQLVDPPCTDPDLSFRHRLQPGDHAQQGRLPAAGRADNNHKLALGDRHVDPVDRPDPVWVGPSHADEFQSGHALTSLLSLSAGSRVCRELDAASG